MVIRVNNHNYFYDRKENKKVEEYDPLNYNLEFVFDNEDGYVVHVDTNKIKVSKTGICFDFNGKTYIIDDNHQQVLAYAAYIINDKYQHTIESDPSKGLRNREEISNLINNMLDEEYSNIYFFNKTSSSLNRFADFRMRVNAEGKICCQTISNLVNSNKFRRDYDLPYYPYIRGIDKFNSFYISLWVTETRDTRGLKYKSEFDLFLMEFISKLNQNNSMFSFSARSLDINSRIIRVRDDLIPGAVM